jgi:tetratricopeptide (TPR) repeat protein
LEEAEASFLKSIRLDPRFVEAFLNRGNLYRKQKKYDRAVADFTSALSIQAHCENAFYFRGFAKYESGDRAGACADWNNLEDPDDFEDFEIISKVCN